LYVKHTPDAPGHIVAYTCAGWQLVPTYAELVVVVGTSNELGFGGGVVVDGLFVVEGLFAVVDGIEVGVT